MCLFVFRCQGGSPPAPSHYAREAAPLAPEGLFQPATPHSQLEASGVSAQQRLDFIPSSSNWQLFNVTQGFFIRSARKLPDREEEGEETGVSWR